VATGVVLGSFLMQDGGARLWECTISFNRHYVGTNNFGMAGLRSHLADFWSSWWILFLIAPAVLLKPFQPRIWFWLGVFALAWLSTGSSLYGHYYILVMPFWALLSAVGIHTLAAYINTKTTRPHKWIGCLMTIIVMVLVCRPDIPWLVCSRERFAEVKMDGYPFRESQLVAKRVAELSSNPEPVYVAGSEPQILFYAGRSSPTRFITTYALMIPTPAVSDYQLEAMNDLQARPPKVIVYVNSSASWMRQPTTPLDFFAFINKFMAENYERVGGYVTDGMKGHWSEPLTDQEAPHASLVIFKRKN